MKYSWLLLVSSLSIADWKPIRPSSPSSDYNIFLLQLIQVNVDNLMTKAKKASSVVSTAYTTTETIRSPKTTSIELDDTKMTFVLEPITTKVEARIKRSNKSLYINKTVTTPTVIGLTLGTKSVSYDTMNKYIVLSYSIPF